MHYNSDKYFLPEKRNFTIIKFRFIKIRAYIKTGFSGNEIRQWKSSNTRCYNPLKKLLLDKNEKYYLEDIFNRFVEPYFSINNYIIYFGWDQISRAYRYVVTPKDDKNKFISFYMDFVNELDEKSLKETHIGFIRPVRPSV